MKRKLLWAVAALVAMAAGGGSPASAQTDVTDTYLVNPSFETLKASDGTTDVTVKTKLTDGLYGWAIADMSDYQVESLASGSSSGFVNGNGVTPSDGTYYYFNRQGWANKNSELKTTTKADVTVGKYYLVFDYKAADYSNRNDASKNGTSIGVTVTDASSNVLAKVSPVKRAYSTANNSSNPGTDAYIYNVEWTKMGIYFEVTTASTLTFAVQQNMVNNGRSDILYDNFKLYKIIDDATNLNLTGLIANPSFEAGNTNGWTATSANDTGARTTSNENYAMSNSKGTYLFNTWKNGEGTLDVKQTLKGLPDGKYKLAAVVGADAESTVTLTAGTATKDAVPEGKATGVSVEVEFDVAGDVTIGVTAPNWFKVDDFQLTYLRAFSAEEMSEAKCKAILDEAYAIYNATTVPTANVGTGAFQYNEAKISTYKTEAAKYANDEATLIAYLKANSLWNEASLTKMLEDFKQYVADMQVLNAPTAGQLFNIINISEGYDYKDNAVTFLSLSDADLTGNTTSMAYIEKTGSVYPQAITFTAADDVENGYTLSYTRADGQTIYVGTGKSTGLGSNDSQIRPTTDKTKAVVLQVKASADTEGMWNLYNTFAKANIGANGKADQGFFTVNNYDSFQLKEAAKTSSTLNIPETQQYATLILPFEAEIPSGVNIYSVAAVSGKAVTLTPESALKANVPYIVEAKAGVTTTLEGYGAAYGKIDSKKAVPEAAITKGLLTGVFAETELAEGTYVLQDGEDGVAFYEVPASFAAKLPAGKAYLTATFDFGSEAKVLYINGEDEATAIAALQTLTQGGYDAIYNAAGVKVNGLQKGLNIVVKDGKSHKIYVK